MENTQTIYVGRLMTCNHFNHEILFDITLYVTAGNLSYSLVNIL